MPPSEMSMPRTNVPVRVVAFDDEMDYDDMQTDSKLASHRARPLTNDRTLKSRPRT